MTREDFWVSAMQDMILSQFLRIAKDYNWAQASLADAKAQLKLGRRMFPDIPDFLEWDARTFVMYALRFYFRRHYDEPPKSSPSLMVDEPDYFLDSEDMICTPFGWEERKKGS